MNLSPTDYKCNLWSVVLLFYHKLMSIVDITKYDSSFYWMNIEVSRLLTIMINNIALDSTVFMIVAM